MEFRPILSAMRRNKVGAILITVPDGDHACDSVQWVVHHSTAPGLEPAPQRRARGGSCS